MSGRKRKGDRRRPAPGRPAQGMTLSRKILAEAALEVITNRLRHPLARAFGHLASGMLHHFNPAGSYRTRLRVRRWRNDQIEAKKKKR